MAVVKPHRSASGRRICVGAGMVQLERSTRCAARSTVWCPAMLPKNIAAWGTA
jgi:hypothetical protein